MRKFLLTFVLLVCTVMSAVADNVTFVASAPRSVAVNQQFRLSYKINRANVGEPSIAATPGFEILSGPHRSTQHSYSSVNGRTESSEQVTFTYILMAGKEGDFTIPAATISVDGNKISSNAVSIKVLPAGQSAGASSQGGGASNRNTGTASATEIAGDELFVRATLSKTKVYEQEAVLLTYKVYSLVNLTNLDNPTPDLKGFHIQEVELPREKQFELDVYNGRNYHSVVWRQFVIFPQQSGSIEIPPLTFEGVVAVQTRRSMDPFEMMFNGRSAYVDVKKTLKTNKLTLNVESLPTGKPSSFTGAVGNFSVKSTLSTTSLKTNEEMTLKITVKGSGNMKLMGAPKVEFPSEFEVYDPVVTNNFSLKSNGFSGEKVYEYLITPRSSGEFTIPAAEFTYFDTATGSYKTVNAESYTVNVEKGSEGTVTAAATYIGKEKNKILATDIRHIKFGNSEYSDEETFFASSLYYATYFVALLLFALCVYIGRRRIAQNSNVSLVRTKKANSVAVKRLKYAKKLLGENNRNGFYDEILKTLWGYISDKLNIPVAQLCKDNVAEEMRKKGLDDTLVNELNNVLNECEFARYAPGDAAVAMDNVYSLAMNVISRIENAIKK
jgi:hypothetical protein